MPSCGGKGAIESEHRLQRAALQAAACIRPQGAGIGPGACARARLADGLPTLEFEPGFDLQLHVKRDAAMLRVSPC